MEDAAEADGVLEDPVDVEDGGAASPLGAAAGDVVDVRHHLLLPHLRFLAGDDRGSLQLQGHLSGVHLSAAYR